MKEHGRLIAIKEILSALTNEKSLNRKCASLFYLKDIAEYRNI